MIATEKTPDMLLYAARSSKGLDIKGLTAGGSICLLRFFPSVIAFALSKDCSLLAFSDFSSVHLLDTQKLAVEDKFSFEGVRELLFSPKTTYLLGYQRDVPKKISQVLVCDLTQKTLLHSFQWNRIESITEFIRFSDNDDYMLVSPHKAKMFLFSCADFSKPSREFVNTHAISMEFIARSEPCFAVVERTMAEFVPVKEEEKVEVAVKCFDLKEVESAKTLVASNNSAVIFWVESESDPSGKSYYGANSAYYRQLLGGEKFCRIMTKGSAIYDIKWNPNGSSFVVVSGTQPAKIIIYDHLCTPLYEVNGGYKNSARYSDGGRFLMLAGLGNLAGDVQFWEAKTARTMVGGCKAPCTVNCEWAENSLLVMNAILSPRMKIDNSATFVHPTGKTLAHDPYGKLELYEVKWIKRRMKADEESIEVEDIGKGSMKPVDPNSDYLATTEDPTHGIVFYQPTTPSPRDINTP